MVNWNKLQIGNYDARYTPLKAIPQNFPKCDSKGKLIPETPRKVTSWKDRFDKVGGKGTFRLINGTPRAKLNRTKIVDNYIEVDKKEVGDLLTEKEYVLDCPLLLDKLQKDKKAWKFGITFGNGFKVYLAYVHTSELYKNVLFMSLGTAQKSTLIKEILAETTDKRAVRDVEITIMGVDRARVEDLIEISQ